MAFRVWVDTGEPISVIQSLEEYFRDGGVSIIKSAFTHTYFVPPMLCGRKRHSFQTASGCQGRRQNMPVGRSKSVPAERSLASVNVRASCSGEVSQRQAGSRLGG